MIYQGLTTAALLGHAAQYHSETEIASVGTGGEKERSSWGEMTSCARRLALALASPGLPLGARCATLARNNCRHLEIYSAATSGGWATHAVDPRLPVDHLWYILSGAADGVLFFDQAFLSLVAQLLPRLPTVKYIMLMELRSEAALSQLPSLPFSDDLLQQETVDYRWLQPNELTPASLRYTSGTTGRSRGVLNVHRSLVLHALSGNQSDTADISAKNGLLPVVPMFHVNAWGMPFIATMIGAQLILPGPRPDGDSLLQLLAAEKVTVGFGVPVVWTGLLAVICRTGVRPSEFKCTLVGGSALLPLMAEAFRRDCGIELTHV